MGFVAPVVAAVGSGLSTLGGGSAVAGGLTAASAVGAGLTAAESRKARKAAGKASDKQEAEIARQTQRERAGLAEEEDELARRRSLASGKSAGRRSLIRTSETGTENRETLG